MLADHFYGLLRPLFAEEASFRRITAEADGLTYRVDWKIPTATRPNKHSRPIHIHITREALEDYRDATRGADRESMERRIVAHIRARLEAFDPDHDVPRELPVPEEDWIITPEIASG